jgi:hypothetical protein
VFLNTENISAFVGSSWKIEKHNEEFDTTHYSAYVAIN